MKTAYTIINKMVVKITDSNVSCEVKGVLIDYIIDFVAELQPIKGDSDQQELANQLLIAFGADYNHFSATDMTRLFDASEKLLFCCNREKTDELLMSFLVPIGCFNLIAIKHCKGQAGYNERVIAILLENRDEDEIIIAAIEAVSNQGLDKNVIDAIENSYRNNESIEIRQTVISTLNSMGTKLALDALKFIIDKEQDIDELKQITLALVHLA